LAFLLACDLGVQKKKLRERRQQFLLVHKKNFKYIFFIRVFLLHLLNNQINMEEKFILIAKGGYLKKMITEEIILSDTDEDCEGFENYEEYKEYVIEDATAEYEQKFAKTFILTEDEYNYFIKNGLSFGEAKA
jgi:hypothetical protein